MKANFIQLNKFVEEPQIIVKVDEDYVRYGTDNQLPYQLTNYYDNVGLNRAIINKKQNMFLGKGISIDITDEKKAKKTLEFLENINPFENIDEIFEKIALDLFIYGGTYLQVIWDKSGKKIKEVYHMNYEQMRSGKKDNYGQVREFYNNTSEEETEKWKTWTDLKEKYIVEMNAFNTSQYKNKQQIYYIKSYNPGKNYYSFPDYIGAIKDLDTMATISDFHNANIHNNMQPGLTFFFTGPEPDEATKDAIVSTIKTKYANSENAGKPMIFWLEDGQTMVMEQAEISQIGEMFDKLSEDTKENIIISHQIPRAVASLATPGSMGSTKEIIEGTELVRLNYIEPIQETFLKKFNKLMEINGLEDVILNAPTPNLMKYDLSELKEILTVDEIREYLGKNPVGDDDKQDDIQDDIQDEENDIEDTETITEPELSMLRKILLKLKINI